YGHQIGDQLLTVAGKVITANMRRMDVAARYGGDEFVLLLPQAGTDQAAHAAGRIREEFCQASAAVLRRERGVTMSAGISALKSNNSTRAEQLVAQADTALYTAKADGRNRITVAQNGIDDVAASRRPAMTLADPGR